MTEIFTFVPIQISLFKYYFLIVLAVFIVISYLPLAKVFDQKVYVNLKGKYKFIALAVLFYSVANISAMTDVLKHNELVASGQVFQQEGVIYQHELKQANSRTESFKVNGVDFKYNDITTPRYFFANRKVPRLHIRNGVEIQAFYIKDGTYNYIYKLAVKTEHD